MLLQQALWLRRHITQCMYCSGNWGEGISVCQCPMTWGTENIRQSAAYIVLQADGLLNQSGLLTKSWSRRVGTSAARVKKFSWRRFWTRKSYFDSLSKFKRKSCNRLESELFLWLLRHNFLCVDPVPLISFQSAKSQWQRHVPQYSGDQFQLFCLQKGITTESSRSSPPPRC